MWFSVIRTTYLCLPLWNKNWLDINFEFNVWPMSHLLMWRGGDLCCSQKPGGLPNILVSSYVILNWRYDAWRFGLNKLSILRVRKSSVPTSHWWYNIWNLWSKLRKQSLSVATEGSASSPLVFGYLVNLSTPEHYRQISLMKSKAGATVVWACTWIFRNHKQTLCYLGQCSKLWTQMSLVLVEWNQVGIKIQNPCFEKPCFCVWAPTPSMSKVKKTWST